MMEFIFEHVIPWGSIVACTIGYGWCMYAIGYKNGQNVVHEWYSQSEPEIPKFLRKQAD